MDIQSVIQPKTMTLIVGPSTVIYDLFRTTGYISISVEDDDFAVTVRPRTVYALWEGVYGIDVSYLYRGEVYRILLKQDYSSGEDCRVWAEKLPGYPEGTGNVSLPENSYPGELTPSDGFDITAPYNP